MEVGTFLSKSLIHILLFDLYLEEKKSTGEYLKCIEALEPLLFDNLYT